MNSSGANQPSAQELRRRIRQHYTGLLLPDRHPASGHRSAWSAAFIVCGQTGCFIFPLPAELVDARHGVLCIPDEATSAVIVTLEWRAEPEESLGALADRWAAYHGKPSRTTWVRATVESAKLESVVVGSEELGLISALGPGGIALRRSLNADRTALAALLKARLGLEADAPVVVGVDEWGIDVRTGFGVVRLAFDQPMDDDDAEERLRALLDA
ncbi:hypothetical protein BH11PLA1_BH11PLA1_15190 [soil metagenome]